MTLTYWYAQCLDDADAFSIRERTRKEAKAAKAMLVDAEGRCGPVIKVSIEYNDGFDLLTNCMDDSRGWWESRAATKWIEEHGADKYYGDRHPF